MVFGERMEEGLGYEMEDCGVVVVVVVVGHGQGVVEVVVGRRVV